MKSEKQKKENNKLTELVIAYVVMGYFWDK
jgi:hypothetical protein